MMDYLNVYRNKVSYPYGGGMAIVIANSVEEAHGILLRHNEELVQYYSADTWEVIVCAFGVGNPRFIDESHHIE